MPFTANTTLNGLVTVAPSFGSTKETDLSFEDFIELHPAKTAATTRPDMIVMRFMNGMLLDFRCPSSGWCRGARTRGRRYPQCAIISEAPFLAKVGRHESRATNVP